MKRFVSILLFLYLSCISAFAQSLVLPGYTTNGNNFIKVSPTLPLPVTGTFSLPSGAATAANQSTEITSLSNIDSNTTGIGTKLDAINTSIGTATYPTGIPGTPSNATLTTALKDFSPTGGNITAVDAGSSTATGQDSSSIITGSATANSSISQAISGFPSTKIQVTGTWSATLEFDQSIDGGTTWTTMGCHVTGSAFDRSSVTGNGIFDCETAGVSNVRVRATAYTSGTVAIKFASSSAPGAIKQISGTKILQGGVAQGLIGCDTEVSFNTSSSGDLQIVALVAAKTIYVCSYEFLAGGTTAAKLEYGTGSNCGTGTTALTPAYPFTTQTGLVHSGTFFHGMKSASANALCINNGSAAQITGKVSYTQF